MKGIMVGAVTASALFSGVVAAEAAYDDRIYAGAAVNIIDAANFERGLQDSRDGIKLFIGKKFSPALGAEFNTSWNYFRRGSRSAHRELSFGIDGMFYPLKCTDAVEPFLKAGVGITVYDETGEFDANASLGGGLNWKLNDHGVSLRTDIALRKMFSDGKFPFQRGDGPVEPIANVGLSIPFGGAPELDRSDCPMPMDAIKAAAAAQEAAAAEAAAASAKAAAAAAAASAAASAAAATSAPMKMDSDADGVIDSADRCPNTAAGAKVDVNGCALPETVVIYFAFDSAQLNSAAKGALDRVAANFGNRTFVVAIANGHADSTGTEQYNMGLSERRAAAVASYLERAGVGANMIRKRAYGEARPAADNESEIGRAKNRRVELNLLRQ